MVRTASNVSELVLLQLRDGDRLDLSLRRIRMSIEAKESIGGPEAAPHSQFPLDAEGNADAVSGSDFDRPEVFID